MLSSERRAGEALALAGKLLGAAARREAQAEEKAQMCERGEVRVCAPDLVQQALKQAAERGLDLNAELARLTRRGHAANGRAT